MNPMAMDPITSPIPNLAAILQTLQLPSAELEALFQSVGQELSVLFLSQSAEGAKLELPGGRVVTVQGELPFPEGTQLRVRVEADGGTLKLQTLEARPPGTPAVLAPLVQGEATALTARLLQTSPAPELAPLIHLLQILGGAPQEPPAPSPSSGALPVVLPPTPVLARAIAALPTELRASLARVLSAPDATPETLAARLPTLAEGATVAVREGLKEVLASLEEGRTAPLVQAATADEILANFQGLMQRVEIPQDHRSALDGWIRSLLSRSAPEAAAPPSSQPLRAVKGEPLLPSRLLTQAETTRVQEAVNAHAGPAVQVPEAWEAWLKGSMRALADPEVSPREAPFHALQAQEGTAFFEIPLPWVGSSPLQMWVEEDASGKSAPGQEQTCRVLLSLNLSHLGETRVGLQSSGNALSVRIWTEQPGMMESQRADVERELTESGKAVNLRILPLSPGADDLRALVGGTNLHAMG